MQFLILFREPDGRQDTHSPEEIAAHRASWQQWMEPLTAQNKWLAGKPLTLEGRMIKPNGAQVTITGKPHSIGTEIVGGFILLEATGIEEATTIMKTCPVYEFGGYAEVRPLM
ncbi:MAG: hypothetical protein JST39_09040 [Bacteroidetes bacterium]|nr:hypothetical protein [Bacteroidota bacterium]